MILSTLLNQGRKSVRIWEFWKQFIRFLYNPFVLLEKGELFEVLLQTWSIQSRLESMKITSLHLSMLSTGTPAHAA